MTDTAWQELIETLKADPEKRSELRRELSPTGGFNPEARAFRTEVKEWERSMRARSGRSYTHLQDGFNIILRWNFNLKNVSSLEDSQVPEARRMFDRYKSQFEEVIKND